MSLYSIDLASSKHNVQVRWKDKHVPVCRAPAALATHLAFAVGGFLLSKVVKKIGGRKVGGGKRHPG